MTGYSFVWISLVVLIGTSCSKSEDEKVKLGRITYLAQCISCHNANPALEGALGPAVKGSSLELLKAKIRRASYPEGYKPKRDTRIMRPLPLTEEEIVALAEFLK
jgi:mono/diheme cytochrome c family protein